MLAFVIAQHADAAASLCAGARTLADEVALVSFGQAPDACADKVLNIAVPDGFTVDDAADTVIAAFDSFAPGVVVVEPTRSCKVIAGKLAAHANTVVISDVTSFTDDGAHGLYFGGVAERTLRPAGEVAIYTVSANAFGQVDPSGTNAAQDLAWVAPARGLKVISSKPIERGGVDLTKADVVVGAGRGFNEEAKLDLARQLCDKIGAGLGCSRPLTEGVNWLPSETYIGVSGLMLAPKVYVACGISGQMQHMVGCNHAGTVFAINKDKDAPVFAQCDYGLVGTVEDILPALVAAL